MQSFMSIIKKDNGKHGETTLSPSEFKLRQSDISFTDELGRQIQKLIDNAAIGEIIELPAETIRVHSLYITKPITLIGKPGTVLEVSGGSIHIDFSLNSKIPPGSLSSSRNHIIS